MTSHHLRLLVCRLALSHLLVALPTCAQADGSRPPAPDFGAIERAAQRVEPQTDYFVILPKRRAECEATAQQYYSTGTVADAITGAQVVSHCLSGMLVQLARLYYRAESFGPDGMPGLIDRLRKPLLELYYRIYYEQRLCQPWCGTMYRPFVWAELSTVLEEAIKTIVLIQFEGNHSGWETWQQEWQAASRAR